MSKTGFFGENWGDFRGKASALRTEGLSHRSQKVRCLLEFRLKRLADGETHRLGSLDFDFGSGLWVAAFAGFACCHLEGAEAD